MDNTPVINIKDELTYEHREMLRMIANSTDSKEMGRALGLSHAQIRYRLQQLTLIFGARDRAHLVAQALRAGVLERGEILTVDEQREELTA